MALMQIGFKNVYRDNIAIGFQIPVVCSQYRGTFASLTDYFDITVNGETFPREKVTCTFGNTTIKQDQLDGSMLMWPSLEPVILTVIKPGGLQPGLYEVQVEYPQRISYLPNPLRVYKDIAKLAIVK
jgi:hypothetical protein